jgi:hypothetical protein
MESPIHPAPPFPPPTSYHHPAHKTNTLPSAWTFFAPSVLIALTVLALWDCPFPRISHLPPLRLLRRIVALIAHFLHWAFNAWERWATLVVYWIAMAPFVAAFIVLTYPIHLLQRALVAAYWFLRRVPLERAVVATAAAFVEVVIGAFDLLKERWRQIEF